MSLYHFVFIHGVTNMPFAPNVDYASTLEDLITSQAKVKDITYSYVDYSDVGSLERSNILKANQKFENENYIDWLQQLDDNIGPDKSLRQLLVQDGGNVLVYQSSKKWRDIIRQRVVDAITPLIDNHKYISVVGHSLGAVVAFDTIYYNVWHNPDWLKANFYPQNLITLGNPQALFSIGSDKLRFNSANIELLASSGKWLNVIASGDIIAYPLEWLYDNSLVEDVSVAGRLLPVNAHNSYWNSIEVAKIIAGLT